MNISNNISSMQAHQTMMNASASSVANVNTDGFIPVDVKIGNADKSVTANLSKETDAGSTKSQTDLAKEIPEQIIAQDAVELNANVIKTQDDILGSLLDIKA